VDEHASLVVADRQMSIEHVAKLGRSSLLNPSCPPVSSDAEHAKKHELVRAQVADRAKRKRELTNYARLKKPAVRQMQFNFLGQLALRPQTVAVPNNQHPDHQLRVDRWPADLAVMGIELLMHIGKRRYHKYINAPEQMVLWDTVVEAKLVN
jgi:hypothetical protein